MTDPSGKASAPPPPTVDVQAIMRRWAAHEAMAATLLGANKRALLACLAKVGIATVVVCFDGYGDSGQIEDVTSQDAENCERPLPTDAVTLSRCDFGQSEPANVTQSLRQAIETISYDILAQTHCGWENNDGAYGEIHFDVAADRITLDYNERYTSSENYSHEF